MWVEATLLFLLTTEASALSPLAPVIPQEPLLEAAAEASAEPAPERPESALLRFALAHSVPDTPYGAAIYRAARRTELSPQLIAAVVEVESRFNAKARSRKGACGLMQLRPSTALRFGVTRRQLFHVEHNLTAGAKYLRWLANRFDGDLPLVLAAYNAGEGAVSRFGGVPPYSETQNYVRRVYRALGLDLPAGVPGLTLEVAAAR
ncbi:MAG: lytic transglycosylase domain-containing protein [Thermoanaerobaculia bacterium]|nr:lytic transglycosylase domain-containing protein [Thermoanaerobaculia bacterium]